mmetsp:Transcript_109610/g.318423  ORF Transcript_109610/g.318423 Transcript_109610/m.318423 type:complete len:467 (+) Transcript_109610:782-2182(+)
MFSCRLCNYDLCEVCSGGTPCESSKTLYRYRLLDNVTAMLPTISWKAPGICEAMRACVQLLPPARAICTDGTGYDVAAVWNPQIVKVVEFVKATLYQVVSIMVELKSIEGDPKNICDLQAMWKPRSFVAFNMAFHDTLSATVRVLIRLTHIYSIQELAQLSLKGPSATGGGAPLRQEGGWDQMLDSILDSSKPVYKVPHDRSSMCGPPATGAKSRYDSAPNSIYGAVLSAFDDEGGYQVLLNLLDLKVAEGDLHATFTPLPPSQVPAASKAVNSHGMQDSQPNTPAWLVSLHGAELRISKCNPEQLEEKRLAQRKTIRQCQIALGLTARTELQTTNEERLVVHMVHDLQCICKKVGLEEDSKAFSYRGPMRRAYIELTTERCKQYLTMLKFLSEEDQTQTQTEAPGSSHPGQGETQSEGGGEGNDGEVGELPPPSMLSGESSNTSTSTSRQEDAESPTTGSRRQVT